MAIVVDYFAGAETDGLHELYFTSGTPTAETSQARNGGRSYYLGTSDVIQLNQGTVGTDYRYVSFGFRYSNNPGTEQRFFEVTTSNTGVNFSLHIATGGDLVLRDSAGSVVQTITGFTTNTWYGIQVMWKQGSSETVEIFIDGTSQGEQTGVDTDDGGTSWRYQWMGNTSLPIFVDDLVSAHSSAGASEAVQDYEIFGYRSTLTGLAPDWTKGANGDLNSGAWNYTQETPPTGNSAFYTDSTARAGGVDTNDVGGSANTGGPNTDANVDGDSNIIAMKGWWKAVRSGGSGSAHYGLMGNTGTAIADSDRTVDLDLTTSQVDYFDYRTDNLPLSTEYGRIGFEKDNKGQDFQCVEMLFQILHVPDAPGGPRTVTCGIESIAVTETDALVVTNVPRVVTGGTESIAVTENDATVSITYPRVVGCTTESIVVTEADASIKTDRGVTGGVESILVIESDATVITTAPLNVICSTESIAVTENDASVSTTTPRAVTGITESIKVSSLGLGVSTYYFDASVSGPTDPDVVWTGDANAFDGSLITNASANVTGSKVSNELYAVGHSGPASGTAISQVRARVYGASVNQVASNVTLHAAVIDGAATLGTPICEEDWATPGWGSYVTLSDPAGGWDWTTLNGLLVILYETADTAEFTKGYRVDLEVTADGPNAVVNRERNATSATESIAVTENLATVTTNVPRVVTCTPESIAVTENNATVSTAIPRNVTCAPESIAVTENDATVSTAIPRNVTCITESIAVTENPATVNSTREITGLSESIRVSYGLETTVGIFDANVAGPTDPNVVWTDDANAFDGGQGSYAYTSTTGISNYLSGTGVNVETPIISTRFIEGVRVRALAAATGGGGDGVYADIYYSAELLTPGGIFQGSDTPAWTSWGSGNLDDPSGGWDWTAIAGLEVRHSGTGTLTEGRVYTTEVEVTYARGSTVSIGKTVTCGIESIAVTENDATIKIDRTVGCSTESIAVTESQATVNNTRNVTGDIESIAVTENQVAINSSRPVTGTTESIAVTENPATIKTDRGTTGLTESIRIGYGLEYVVGYFDVSIAGPADAGVAWTDDANAFNGLEADYAYTSTEGNESSNALVGSGISLENPLTLGRLIDSVNVRIYGSAQGSGTPQLLTYVYVDGENQTPGGISNNQTTPYWTAWGSGGIGGPTYWHDVDRWTWLQNMEVRFAGYDGSGVLTEAQAYVAQVQVEYERGSTVNKGRTVGCATESIAVTENQALVNGTLDVSAGTEVIVVTENIAQVFRGDNLDVGCTTELIVVTENAATVTTTTPRVVTCTTESILVLENQATVTKDVTASTRRVFIVT